MTFTPIAIVGGARTPFVRARGVFKKMSAAMLGGVALRETVLRTGIDPKLIDEIMMGIVSAPAEGSNIAREALFDAGLPPEIPCTTVNRYCASALEAISIIASKIQAGDIEIGIAGGVESISSVRALFSNAATDYFQDFGKMRSVGQQLGHLAKIKLKYFAPHAPGITEATTGLSMGQSADLMARLFEVTRQEQDQFAMDSHLKAHRGWENGFYQSHVAPVATPQGVVIDRDTDIRSDTTMEKLAKLRPVFYKDGTITAGNASPLTDGASAVLLMKESRAKELGLPILGVIRAVSATAVNIQTEPLLIGPAYGFPKVLKAAGVQFSEIDLFEIHEAFAAQVLSTTKALASDEFCRTKLGLPGALGQVPADRLNPNGGSIPLGHPFGATGGRMVLQTLHGLKQRKQKLGLISICAAGGLGLVAVIESR